MTEKKMEFMENEKQKTLYGKHSSHTLHIRFDVQRSCKFGESSFFFNWRFLKVNDKYENTHTHTCTHIYIAYIISIKYNKFIDHKSLSLN